MGDRSSLTDLIVDNSHHLIHLHFGNLHSFLGWEILPVNETYWKDLHRNVLQNGLVQESFFRHLTMWSSSSKLACVGKGFFFRRNWIWNLFTKKHPVVLGEVSRAWLWKERHSRSQTIPCTEGSEIRVEGTAPLPLLVLWRRWRALQRIAFPRQHSQRQDYPAH